MNQVLTHRSTASAHEIELMKAMFLGSRNKTDQTPVQTPPMTGLQGFIDLLGAVACLVGVLLLVMAAVNTFLVYNESRSWTTIEGQLVSSDIYQSQMRAVAGLRKGTGYGVRYLIRYKVDENVYISSADAGIRSWNRSGMEGPQKAFSPGQKIAIRYHPENVGTIRLVGSNLWTFAPFAWLLLKIGVIVLLVGLALRALIKFALKSAQKSALNQHPQP